MVGGGKDFPPSTLYLSTPWTCAPTHSPGGGVGVWCVQLPRGFVGWVDPPLGVGIRAGSPPPPCYLGHVWQEFCVPSLPLCVVWSVAVSNGSLCTGARCQLLSRENYPPPPPVPKGIHRGVQHLTPPPV